MSGDFNWKNFGEWEDRMEALSDRREHEDVGCAVCLDPDEDGNVFPGCSNCHRFSVLLAVRNGCELCQNELEHRILKGDWCAKRPLEHGGTYMDIGVKGRCLECEHELKTGGSEESRLG
jgi:hypothetical protein